MRAKVTIIREAGQLHVPIASSRKLRGDLSLIHAPVPHENRTVAVLRVLGSGSERVLFDPKITRLGAGTIVFSGLERIEHAWHAQEWFCDIDQ